MRKLAICGLLVLWAGARLSADFSYQHISRVTGGMMAGAMKVAAVFSKEAREPLRTSYFVKGNRLATISRHDAQIIDLDRETITHVDFDKKTFSVLTFAEMAELLKELESRMAAGKGKSADVSFKVSVEPTSETKSIAGMDARLVRMRIEMEGTDKKSGKREIIMSVTSEQWIAAVPGYQEVRDFFRRMAQKIPWVPSAGFLGGQDAQQARAMAELRKLAAELDGLAVLEVTRMHMVGEQAVAGRPQPEARPAEEQPSIGSALGRLGGLGRFGRPGKNKETPQQPPPEQAGQSAAASPQGESLLMETTSEASGFSTAPIDPSRFEVPAGFKQVDNELKKLRR